MVHVLWLTSGLGCDGESVAMTAATNPSLEDLLRGVLPGMPRIVIYNPMLAFETGEEFVRRVPAGRGGRARPVRARARGLGARTSSINGEGHWAGFGVDPETGQPITTTTWIDRLAPRAAAVLALGTCAAYGGIPAMRGNPTGAMGLRDHLGRGWRSRARRADRQPAGLPGPARQHHRDAAPPGAARRRRRGPLLDLDEQGRPRWLFERTVQEGCGRAGFAEQGEFARTPADHRGCLVKLGCKGPVVKCNVPLRGWIGGDRRLPERRRHLHRVHDAGLPRQVHAVHGARAAGARRPDRALHLRPVLGAAPPGDPPRFDVEPARTG